ncbi:MAG: ABC transporter permease subunit [Acidobacteriota bacterium]
MSEQSAQSFTGRHRERTTKKSVLVADRVARGIITVGGIGTILAVLGVAVFLIYVVAPLFLPAKVDGFRAFDPDAAGGALYVDVDEYRTLGWMLRGDGSVEVYRLDNGELRYREQVVENVTASSFLISGELAAFGLADGSVQLNEIGFDTEILNADSLPEEIVAELDDHDPGFLSNYENGIVEKTPQGQYRVQQLGIELVKKRQVATGPVVAIEHVIGPDGPLVVALAGGDTVGGDRVGGDTVDAGASGEPVVDVAVVDDAAAGAAASDAEIADAVVAAEDADAAPAIDIESVLAQVGETQLYFIEGREDSNFLTGRTTIEFLDPITLPIEPFPADRRPAHIAVAGTGNGMYVAWDDGELMRIDTTEGFDVAYVAERGRLIPEGNTLTVFDFVLGNNTLVWGDSAGTVSAGFPVRSTDIEDPDAAPVLFDVERDPRATSTFLRTKQLKGPGGAAASALSSSERSRMILAGFDDGGVRMYNITNASELSRGSLPVAETIHHIVMAPKEDGMAALTGGQLYNTSLDPRFPEASFKALFLPVWYEARAEPQHIWQSSSATDDFEMKLGLIPLVFGTLKATFYSMIFGAPLALLAALYTSEFLEPKVKAVIKPGIELMASLPSVVLGFLAALVFAPFVEKIVPAVLAGFITVPVAFLVGAYIWQMVPPRLTILYSHWRIFFVLLTVPLGVFLASVFGPIAEEIFFAGDIKQWLAYNGEPGVESPFADATGGWMMLWLPLSALIVGLVLGRVVDPIMRTKSSDWDRGTFALVDAGKFLVAVVAMIGLAWAVSAALSMLGFDPRGSYIDTYVQRNSLIVGFVMGFAIIPIIYTISEDALSTVPSHLRSASLGAGATPWQTATRIVIPTAMSGLFSALMVGLGRAVGETMIVLMATGNTPVLDLNIFEGFRTLSANIAVELPEAVRDSTHYRTLFLAALTLFVMTFVVNTIAERVRLRFRKRAYQL